MHQMACIRSPCIRWFVHQMVPESDCYFLHQISPASDCKVVHQIVLHQIANVHQIPMHQIEYNFVSPQLRFSMTNDVIHVPASAHSPGVLQQLIFVYI